MSSDLPDIEVTFIDDNTGKPFGVTTSAADTLPESFAVDTTVHIGNDNWSVVSATPQTREEYSRSRRLTLRLRRIELIDPGEILFSLPSICDALAPLASTALSGNEFVLLDDDWRQIEFVSNSFEIEIKEEIVSVRHIHEHESASVGWHKTHVRTKPVQPIVSNLTLSHLARAMDCRGVLGVSYHGYGSPVAEGFSLNTGDGLTLYGIAPSSTVQVLGIAHTAADTPSEKTLQQLAGVAQDFDLCLVNWCRCVRALPGDPWFNALLLGEDAP